MRCPECGAVIPNESVFCSACGSIVSRANAPQNLKLENLKVAKSKVREIRDIKFYMVVCYAILLAIAAIGIVMRLADSYVADNPIVFILSLVIIVVSIISIVFLIKVLISLSELGKKNITVFQMAFTWGIINLVCSICSSLAGENTFVTLLAAGIDLVFTYYYVEAFRQLMEPEFPETASKWKFYWKLCIGLVVCEMVAVFIAFVASTSAEDIIAVLLVLVPAIVALALPFVELRYLDETADQLDNWVSRMDETLVPSWMNSNDIQ